MSRRQLASTPLARRCRRKPNVIATAVMASVAFLALAGGISGASGTPSTGAKGVISGGAVVAAAQKLLPASAKNAGTLSDYVNFPYQPMEFYVPGTQNPEGVDIDIANALGAALGMKISFTNVLFPDLFTALESGRAQFVISGAYDAPSRRGSFDFIDYFKTGTTILTTKQNEQNDKIHSFSALCGKSVATVSGTDYVQEIQALSKKYCGSSGSVQQVLSNSPAQDALNVSDGRAVAAFDQGTESARYFLDHQQGVVDSGKWAEVGPSYYPTDYALILAKHSPLEPALMAAMKGIFANGTYAKILKKWNLSANALAAPTLNAGPPIP